MNEDERVAQRSFSFTGRQLSLRRPEGAPKEFERGISMSKPSTFARVALAAAAGVMALSTGVAAQAQPYGSSGYSAPYYDTCRREANNRGIVGALLGAGIGATVCSQVAARGHRTDGSVLGGALGALGGAAVGSNTAACTP